MSDDRIEGDMGDPLDEVLGAWLAKEVVRSIYLSDDVDEAAVLLDNAIEACASDDVPEIRTIGPHLVALAHRDLEPPSNRCIERTDRRHELLCQAGQAGRPRAHELRALQPPSPLPRRAESLA